MEQKTCLWWLNSASQNDLLVAEFSRTKNLDGLQLMLEDGFPLTAYILSVLVAHQHTKPVIKSLISKAVKVDEHAKEWIAGYFEIQDIWKLYASHPELATADFPSNDDCVKFKLWKVLFFRKEHSLIAENAPEFLEEQDDLQACVALLQVNFDKYASLVWDKKFYNAFLWVKDGWKYLIDHGIVKTLLEKDCGELLPQAEIVEYCLQKGLVDELYEARKYDELLEHGDYEVFVKNRSFYASFLEKFSDKVDWESLWENSSCGHDYLIEEAFKNVFVENCSKFLWKHTGIIGKLRLLSGG